METMEKKKTFQVTTRSAGETQIVGTPAPPAPKKTKAPPVGKEETNEDQA